MSSSNTIIPIPPKLDRCSFNTGRLILGIASLFLSVFILTHTTFPEKQRVQAAFSYYVEYFIPVKNMAAYQTSTAKHAIDSIKHNLIEVEAGAFLISGLLIMLNMKKVGAILFILADIMIIAAKDNLTLQAILSASSEIRNDKVNYILQHCAVLACALIYLLDKGNTRVKSS